MARRAQPGNKTVGKLTSKKDIRKTNLGGNQANRWTITGKKGGSTNQPPLLEWVSKFEGRRGEEQSRDSLKAFADIWRKEMGLVKRGTNNFSNRVDQHRNNDGIGPPP